MKRFASLLLVSFLGGCAFADDPVELERMMVLEARKEQKARILDPIRRKIKAYDAITISLLKSIPNGTFANFVNITGPKLLKLAAYRADATGEYLSWWVFGGRLWNWGSRPPK